MATPAFLPALTTKPLSVVSSGEVSAPSAGAVLADSGALAAGDYDLDIHVFCSDSAAAGKAIVIEHRNAANDATLFVLAGCAVNAGTEFNVSHYQLATNERIRCIAGTTAGAAQSLYVACVMWRAL